jgi:hypothetical protein
MPVHDVGFRIFNGSYFMDLYVDCDSFFKIADDANRINVTTLQALVNASHSHGDFK